MLRSTNRKARENIRAYIMEHFTPENYTDNPPQEWPEVAAFILDTFRSEKPPIGAYRAFHRLDKRPSLCY